MKKILLSSALAASGLLVLGTIANQEAFAQSSTTGALRGVIRDGANGKPLAGATVVISSTALQGDSYHITEDNGAYIGDNLPPGIYLVTVYYNEAEFSRTGIEVQVGKLAIVNFRIDTTKGEGEKIIIAGTTPLIDLGSSKTGSTISEEFTTNIPVGRTFASVLDTAGGSQGDSYGQSFYGSTSVESTYVVEGLNTTDTAYGGISTNLPSEFIDETEVITGGYAAEFGRSTGGAINVVTKRGSNEFKGSVFGYFTPGSLQAEATEIRREGSSIGIESDLKYRWDLGAEIGGPIIKDKLWFHVGLNPSFVNDDVRRTLSSYTDENNDGINDVDTDTGFSVLEEVGATRTPVTSQTYYYTSKISAAISEDHQAQLSLFGNPSSTKNNYRTTGAESSRLQTVASGSFDTSFKWNSSFGEGKTQVEAVLGYHKAGPSQDPRSSAQDIPQIQFNSQSVSLERYEQFEDAYSDRCTDGGPNDDYSEIVNCPTSRYNVGGLGYIESAANDRFSAVATVSQRLEAAGTHTFKLGLDYEQTIYDATRGYTGSERYTQLTNGNWRQDTFLELDTAGDVPCGIDADEDGILDQTCSISDSVAAATKSAGIAAFLQDSWQITPGLSFNPGIRWEQQTGFVAESLVGNATPEGEIIPEKAFEIKNMISPRIGLVYDPTEEGKSKFFAHWGRFYEAVPLDINVRAFGGELQQQSNITAADCAGASDPTDPTPDFTGCDAVYQRTLGGAITYVSPGMKGQYLNEVVLGGEYEVAPDFKMGLTYVHRSLPRVIEDISTDGGFNYLITNPGENFDDAAADLDEQAAELEANGETVLAELYAFRADLLRGVKKFDKPVRNYDALQITAQRRFSKDSLLLATYTFSRNVGNFPGLYSTETDQLDPNLTSLYDLPDLMANRYGELGLSRPHSLKLDGFYRFDLKESGAVTLGSSFRAQSGIPQNTLGSHIFYGSSEAFILPRGTEARNPTVWSADLKIQYGRKINKRTGVEVFADIFNVFDIQTATETDDTYTFDSINPIVDGDASDLVHAKSLDGDGQQASLTPLLNPNFKNATDRQAPRIFRFGVRVTF
ncbi:MAG: TonB-dependent receptor [Myxococcales bacterium]|nr:TonB-dependent receptor [Myxococcales bacterium]